MKNLLLALSVWLSLCCAGSEVAQAQGTYFQGAMVPSAAPFIGYAMLAKSGASSSHTGDTNETVLATIAIPPNTIGANGAIKVTAFFTCTNSANNKSFKFRLGGTALTGTSVLSFGSITTIANFQATGIIMAANATSSQNTQGWFDRGSDHLQQNQALVTSAIDMTAAENIVITGALALGTETITLIGYTIEVIN